MSEAEAEVAAREAEERAAHDLADYNNDRRRDKLRRQIQRSHEWRVQVWSQMELKIRAAQASLEVLDADRVELFKPQFDDDQMLYHYSSMPLSK